MVFPNKMMKQQRKFKGGQTDEPIPGIHHNVAVLDFASLYPTVIATYNLSPETFITSQQLAQQSDVSIDDDIIPLLEKRGASYVDTLEHEQLFGGRYLFYSQKTKQGIFPKLMKYLFMQRVKIRKEMRQPGIDPHHKNALDKRQYVYKIFMNATYGAFGNKFFRFFFPQIADSITYFARRSLQAAQKYITSNYDVTNIYSDTDSVNGQSMIQFFIDGKKYNDTIENLYVNYVVKQQKYKDGVLGFLRVPVDTYYYSDGDIRVGKINKLYRHLTDKQQYQIILDDNSSIKVTGDHSVALMRDGQLLYGTVNEIKQNDKMIKR